MGLTIVTIGGPAANGSVNPMVDRQHSVTVTYRERKEPSYYRTAIWSVDFLNAMSGPFRCSPRRYLVYQNFSKEAIYSGGRKRFERQKDKRQIQSIATNIQSHVMWHIHERSPWFTRWRFVRERERENHEAFADRKLVIATYVVAENRLRQSPFTV